jgi:hypothetical protein
MSPLDVILAVIAGIFLFDMGFSVGKNFAPPTNIASLPYFGGRDPAPREIREIHVGPNDIIVLATDAKLGQEEVQRIAQKFLVESPDASGGPLIMDRGLHVDCVIRGALWSDEDVTTEADVARDTSESPMRL